MARTWKWQPLAGGSYGRWTKTRDLVLDFLSKERGHLSAKEIYRAISAIYPQIGLATIYRTLELLTRLGYLNRLVSQDGQNLYEFKGLCPKPTITISFASDVARLSTRLIIFRKRST